MPSEWPWLTFVFLALSVVLGAAVLFLGFLLLGTLRTVGRLSWRLDQLEATTPSRLGRNGLKPGKRAPDFTLPSVAGSEIGLHEFAGRRVLLVFTQAGCGPCQDIMPELNQLGGRDLQVLVVNKGDVPATRQWAVDLRIGFPVLVQEGLDLARKYEVFATPFAFLIDEKGMITSKGIVKNKQHLGFLMSARPEQERNGHAETGATAAEEGAVTVSHSSSNVKEIGHD
jgi:methylamine dehydrogenase accessory protein MauD